MFLSLLLLRATPLVLLLPFGGSTPTPSPTCELGIGQMSGLGAACGTGGVPATTQSSACACQNNCAQYATADCDMVFNFKPSDGTCYCEGWEDGKNPSGTEFVYGRATTADYDSSAYVGGDPVTIYGGIEYKFDLPIQQHVKLLETADVVVHATAMLGEQAAEQWINRISVDTTAGEPVVDIRIRQDIAILDRKRSGLETLEVEARWLPEQVLALPEDDKLVHWGSLMLLGHNYVHPRNITLELFRVRNPIGSDPVAPRRECVMISCKSVRLLVSSTSAWEYYYEDPTSQRALKYAHLDMDILDMQKPSSLSGLLPELWGIRKSF